MIGRIEETSGHDCIIGEEEFIAMLHCTPSMAQADSCERWMGPAFFVSILV